MLATVTKRAEPPEPQRAAAFFDLDKTVIAKSSTLAFSRPFLRNGLINRRAALKGAYAQFVFAASGADADQVERMRAHLTALCTGWDVQQVRAVVEETLHDIVDPLVYAEAAELIADHTAEGRDVVVVSASGDEIVSPISAMVGATRAMGTRMVAVNGRYTGEIEFYCYGQNKATAIKELAAEEGYDLAASHAYSDSITDLPMLEAVGHPTVVNPDRGLRALALERGWPILEFTKPVSLRSRFHGRPGTAVAVTAIGIGAIATAGATWYGIHRRRKR
ncbi:HAD-IB family hydrolase [Actinophytocola xanthii]|uniref:Inhibition of morphological differentiation protein n=1 Tax=Actinophytocola xanthii TaxID=1912961 RepID=A0A1Q8CNA0_9PSEU|nr:HAD-IB family hydrolase [Actinophytocola xanthii]OLF15842.1 inhibition of morphological differentiation protein [Actinophytocola xanthii]